MNKTPVDVVRPGRLGIKTWRNRLPRFPPEAQKMLLAGDQFHQLIASPVSNSLVIFAHVTSPSATSGWGGLAHFYLRSTQPTVAATGLETFINFYNTFPGTHFSVVIGHCIAKDIYPTEVEPLLADIFQRLNTGALFTVYEFVDPPMVESFDIYMWSDGHIMASKAPRLQHTDESGSINLDPSELEDNDEDDNSTPTSPLLAQPVLWSPSHPPTSSSTLIVTRPGPQMHTTYGAVQNSGGNNTAAQVGAAVAEGCLIGCIYVCLEVTCQVLCAVLSGGN
jgi:hypothetical protein